MEPEGSLELKVFVMDQLKEDLVMSGYSKQVDDPKPREIDIPPVQALELLYPQPTTKARPTEAPSLDQESVYCVLMDFIRAQSALAGALGSSAPDSGVNYDSPLEALEALKKASTIDVMVLAV